MSLSRNSIGILLLASSLLFSYQTAPEYFHGAAQTYVLLGDGQRAKAIITEGLGRFPGDPQLNALANKIKDEEKNRQNKNQDQQKQDEQKQDQNQQKDQPQPDKKQEEMKKEEAKRMIMQFSDDAKDLNKPIKLKATGEKKPDKDW